MNTAACRTILHATDWHSENLPPPPAQRDWLLHRGSLTARLRQHGDIRVHIEHEGWSDDQPPVWQRDVWLAARHDPASGLYARHSTLLVHGGPLHIAELFLAAFPWP